MVYLLSHSFLTSLKACRWLYKLNLSFINTVAFLIDYATLSLNESVKRRNAVAYNIGWFWIIFITWNILLDKIIRYNWKEHFWLTGLFCSLKWYDIWHRMEGQWRAPPNGSKLDLVWIMKHLLHGMKAMLQSLVIHASAVAPSPRICTPIIILVYLFKFILLCEYTDGCVLLGLILKIWRGTGRI